MNEHILMSSIIFFLVFVIIGCSSAGLVAFFSREGTAGMREYYVGMTVLVILLLVGFIFNGYSFTAIPHELFINWIFGFVLGGCAAAFVGVKLRVTHNRPSGKNKETLS